MSWTLESKESSKSETREQKQRTANHAPPPSQGRTGGLPGGRTGFRANCLTQCPGHPEPGYI